LIVHRATDIDIASECSCRLWGPAVDELLGDSTRNLCNIECGRVIRGSSRACRSADVTLGPNVLHLVLLVFALPCARYTLSEMRHRPLPRGRLAAPALLAMGCALVFLFIHLGTQRPPWMFAAALAAGLAIGALRGFTLQLQVDHMFDKIRLPRARGSFLVALGLVAAVLLEIGGSFAGPNGLPFRLIAPEIAAACAGMLTGRAMAIAMRWRRAPHVDLHRL
jgi:hypothetical protein